MQEKHIKRMGGFSLIEMLVVVLIIGILSAIALPQYQKVIEKARASKVLPVLRSLYNAGQQYYLVHKENPSKFSDLGVKMRCESNTVRWTTQVVPASACTIGEWTYQVYNLKSSTADYVVVGRITGPYAGTGFGIYYTGSHKGKILCMERRSAGVSFINTSAGHKKGDYCQKFFNGTPVGNAGTLYEFTIN